MVKQRLIKPLLLLGLLAVMTPVYAAGAGTAVGVNPEAVARLKATDRILVVGADIAVGETVVTGPQGQVQIVFADATRLVVGPQSSLLIEDYLLDNPDTAQRLVVNALSGSFRFISGNSPKAAYAIKSPTAAIAVRGTSFDLISAPGDTRVMLYEGGLQVCNLAGVCTDVGKRCEVGIATGEQATRYSRDDPLRLPHSLLFRYARFQGALLPDFRVSGTALCAEQPVVSEPPSDSSSSGSTAPTQGQGQPGAQGPTTPIVP